jgi:hypothetical protein
MEKTPDSNESQDFTVLEVKSLLGPSFYEAQYLRSNSQNDPVATCLEYPQQLSLKVKCKSSDSGYSIVTIQDENRVCSQTRSALRENQNSSLQMYGKKGKANHSLPKAAQPDVTDAQYREEEQEWLSWSNMLLTSGIEPAGINAGLPLGVAYRPSNLRSSGDSFVLAGLKRSQYREKIPKHEFSKAPERFVGLCLLLETVTSVSSSTATSHRETIKDFKDTKDDDAFDDIDPSLPAYTLAFASRYPMRQAKLAPLSPTISSFYISFFLF